MAESKSAVSRQTPSTLTVGRDPVAAALDRFAVIRYRPLRTGTAYLPIVLAFLLVLDWLVGRSAFAGDPFRLSALLAVIVELLVIGLLFGQVPDALRTVWARGLVGLSSGVLPAPTTFLGFIRQFEAALNSKFAHLVGAIFGLGGLLATYPISFWITNHNSPYKDLSQWMYFYFGTGAILEIPLAYVIGLLFWRFGVIPFFITRLGERFEIKIQPGHPDRSGGLRPLGNLSLINALLILVPALFFSVWIAVANLKGMEAYLTWSELFKKGLVVLSIAAAVLFFRPLYHIHLQMERQRRKIQRDLDELSHKMEEIALKLRAQADTLSADEGDKLLKTLEFMNKVYKESSRVPTWPFDGSIIVKLVAAEAVPVLSLIGASGSLLKAIEPLISLLPR